MVSLIKFAAKVLLFFEIAKSFLPKMRKIAKSFLLKMRKIAKCLICKLEKERNIYVLITWRDGYQLLPACGVF